MTTATFEGQSIPQQYWERNRRPSMSNYWESSRTTQRRWFHSSRYGWSDAGVRPWQSETMTDLRRCIRFLIHWGLVEIRNLGYASAPHAQIADLADILEFLPEFLEGGREPRHRGDPRAVRGLLPPLSGIELQLLGLSRRQSSPSPILTHGISPHVSPA